MTIKIADGRSELWQWDTARTLAVDADCSQVHFSNKVFGRSIDVDVTDGAAIIPDILLQTDNDLNVWAFVGTADNGYTKISKTFKVNRRNRPAGYVFTPTEQTTLAELSGRLDRIEEYQDPDAIKNAVDDYLAQNPVGAPVQSVNGKTGAVELNAEDVGAIAETELQTAINTALAKAKASGEFDGADGKDGADGVGIQSVEQTVTSTEDGGTNVITVTKTDGTSSTFAVKNGSKGSTGATGAAGQDGHSPVVTATKSGKKTTISVDGTAIATVEDGADGAPGKNGSDGKPGAAGADGVTPHIGNNGNWYLGTTDTGKPSRGEKGDPGKNGSDASVTEASITSALGYKPAAPGSSEFVINATVASDDTCTTDKTFAQIQEAVQSGKRAVVKTHLDGSDLILPQVGKFLGYYAFSTVFCADASLAKQYTIFLGQQDNGVIICRVVTYNSDDNLPQVNMAADPTQDMEIATKQYVDASSVPTVTAADNGKFLRVVNGAWAAATIADGSEVAY